MQSYLKEFTFHEKNQIFFFNMLQTKGHLKAHTFNHLLKPTSKNFVIILDGESNKLCMHRPTYHFTMPTH